MLCRITDFRDESPVPRLQVNECQFITWVILAQAHYTGQLQSELVCQISPTLARLETGKLFRSSIPNNKEKLHYEHLNLHPQY